MSLTKHNKVLRVFEHAELRYQKNGSFQKEHWEALSRYNEKYGNRYFTVLHNGIKFSSYVGVIQAGNITIEVLPKTDRENLNTEEEKKKWHNMLLDMLQACRLIRINQVNTANLQLKSNSILEIYIAMFLQEVEKLLHKGLIKKYRRHPENIPVLKGRLDFNRHITVNLVHKEKFFVQHTVYDRENILNQILHEALKIIPSLNPSSSLKSKLHNIKLNFPELPPLKITPALFNRLYFNRGNLHYKPALDIAKMLLLNYRPNITGGTHQVIAILFDMNFLWEEYIFRKLWQLQTADLQVSRQQSQHFWQGTMSIKPSSIIPDIVIRKGDQVFILDTKWKLVPDLKPAAEDLKQMFVYNLYWKCTHSILLYPGAQYQRHTGAYLNFHSQELPKNNCSIATCNVLDEHNKLDGNIALRILSELCGLI